MTSRGVLGDLCAPKNAEFLSEHTVQISLDLDKKSVIYAYFDLKRGFNVTSRRVLGDLCTPKNAEFFFTQTVQIS